ncbi:hypothetical protein L1887_49859 [Cichorium endivia]|nr:hypothetical protein L1887_49859 [Cichorium endivia]
MADRLKPRHRGVLPHLPATTWQATPQSVDPLRIKTQNKRVRATSLVCMCVRRLDGKEPIMRGRASEGGTRKGEKKIRGVLDLQVYDARRHIQDESPFLAGLNTAVLRSHGRSAPKWIQKKVTERSYKGRRYVDQKGGSSASLYARPLTRSVLFYCSLDAILLPYMMSAFVLAPETMREEVLRASGLRVLDALSAGFSVNAPERKLKEDGYLLPS